MSLETNWQIHSDALESLCSSLSRIIPGWTLQKGLVQEFANLRKKGKNNRYDVIVPSRTDKSEIIGGSGNGTANILNSSRRES